MKKLNLGIKNCIHCNKEIQLKTVREIERKKYCSKDCYNNAHRRGTRNCLICNKEFKVQKCREDTAKTCSKICMYEYVRRAPDKKRNKILELHKEGWNNTHISILLDIPRPTVTSILNVILHREPKFGTSKSAIVKRWKKQQTGCLICGWTRCIDAAHIIPAAKGGPLEEFNLIPLCPNHHRLFDYHKLNEDEINKIKERIENANKVQSSMASI